MKAPRCQSFGNVLGCLTSGTGLMSTAVLLGTAPAGASAVLPVPVPKRPNTKINASHAAREAIRARVTVRLGAWFGMAVIEYM
jgi:hypothetical protein